MRFFVAAGQSPAALVVDANNVYWLNTVIVSNQYAWSVMKAPAKGGATTMLASGPLAGQTTFWSLAFDATNVYWTNSAKVMSVPIAGGSPTTVAQSGSPDGLVVDATSIYWVDKSTNPNPIMKLARP
jgi:hypothetical protein